MKAKLFIVALSAILFSACSQNDSEVGTVAQSKKVIGFSVGDLSRADIRDVQSVYKDGFKFTAVWAGSEVCSNTAATWNGSAFETVPQMFWPLASEELPCVFHAISYPGISTNPISYKDGKNSFEYEVASQAEKQQDVVVASVKATEVPENGVQRIVFTHALTKVNFTVYVENNEVNNNYIWRLSSVSLKTKNKGTYTFDAETPWHVADSYADMQYMTSNQTVDVSKGGSWYGMNNFMLIPQNGEDLTVTLTWAVYLNTGNNTLVKVSKKDATKRFKISTADWKPGVSKRYTNLRLPNIGENTGSGDDGYDDNNMEKTSGGYDIEVEPWQDEK